MAGIYTRDNREQILTAALENAMRRKQEYTDRKNARAQENAKAISEFLKAAGRTYETWGSDEEKLAALEKEREEAIKAQQEHDAEIRTQAAEYAASQQPTVQPNQYVISMQGYDPRDGMRGYGDYMARASRGVGARPTNSLGLFDGVI